jgi:hypothetical protein
MPSFITCIVEGGLVRSTPGVSYHDGISWREKESWPGDDKNAERPETESWRSWRES